MEIRSAEVRAAKVKSFTGILLPPRLDCGGTPTDDFDVFLVRHLSTQKIDVQPNSGDSITDAMDGII